MEKGASLDELEEVGRQYAAVFLEPLLPITSNNALIQFAETTKKIPFFV